jgi:hypothetical protein
VWSLGSTTPQASGSAVLTQPSTSAPDARLTGSLTRTD